MIKMSYLFLIGLLITSQSVWSQEEFQLVFPVVNIVAHFTLEYYVLVCLYVLTQPFFWSQFYHKCHTLRLYETLQCGS